MKVDILGTEYKIVKKNYEEAPIFKELSISGYHSSSEREIAVCDMRTYPGYANHSKKAIKRLEREILRHEVLHAFFKESGLDDCANVFGSAWVNNEEMIDWFAIQSPKLFKIYEQLGILE